MQFSRYRAISFLSALALCILPSCSNQVSTPRPAIDYVGNILADRSGDDYKIVSSFDSTRVDGPICIVGEPERCIYLSEAFMTSDSFDNVTGARKSDALPDFSGERILSLMDKANAPYGGYLNASNTAFLRELAVRHMVSCLDTVTFVSPFDKEGMGRKSPAKMIVLASPYMSAYGCFDADTLFTCLGLPSPVISPLDLMFGKSLASASQDRGVSVGLIADSLAIADGVYRMAFTQACRKAACGKSELVQKPASGSGNELAAFLESYAAAGGTAPLSALVVDDFTVDISSLEEELAAVRVELSDESLRFGKLLADDFRILDPRSTLTAECYGRMRKKNSFTHNIAYPAADALVSMPSTELQANCYAEDGSLVPEFKYVRQTQSEVPTYYFIQFNYRYLPESLMELLRDEAIKTYLSYVQK